MSEIRYVVRYYSDGNYLYSVHCSARILDDLICKAKDIGHTVKVLAYEFDESEVSNEV